MASVSDPRERPAVAGSAPAAELCGMVALDAVEGSIAVDGEDAAGFLQGQLTNDIDAVTPTSAQVAAYCTAKGRVLATLLVYRTTNGYAFALPRELAEPIARRLKMYVLRARVSVADSSAATAFIGLIGETAANALQHHFGLSVAEPFAAATNGDATAVALPGARVLLAVPCERAGEVRATLADHCPVRDLTAWQRAGIAAGRAEITPPTQDQFVPQMLNLELTGAVSFTKGCYTGQEIVARSQHLGEVKRRLLRFKGSGALQAGDAIFDSTTSIGVVVNAAAAGPSESECLAVVATAAAHTALRTAAGAPLTRLPLPYAIPGAD